MRCHTKRENLAIGRVKWHFESTRATFGLGVGHKMALFPNVLSIGLALVASVAKRSDDHDQASA